MQFIKKGNDESIYKLGCYRKYMKKYSYSDNNDLIREKILLESEIETLKYKASLKSNNIMSYITIILSLISLVISLVDSLNKIDVEYATKNFILIIVLIFLFAWYLIKQNCTKTKDMENYNEYVIRLKIIEEVLNTKS